MPDRIAAAALRALPPEAAHDLALAALSKIPPGQAGSFPPGLQTSVFGITFTHPVGLAAGFDKNARVISAFNRLGWGFTEIGGVTPLPQPGNPKPRLFRLPGSALVNHMGFNSEGLDRIRARLAARPAGIPVFANLGTNRNTVNPVDDSETLLDGLYGLADGFTLNVSSPNTPGLATMQRPENLAAGIARLRELRDRLAAGHAGPPAPLLIKVSPDLSEGEIGEIAEVCMAQRIDGVIATNTSQILRRELASGPAARAGGLSGPPLRSRATAVLRALDARFAGTVPLIAVGGIDTAGEAYARIRAGASLVQIYSAMIWKGPRIGPRIARGLARLLARDGYGSIAEAVGAERRP